MSDFSAFLAILFTALALVPGGAHALELANKMKLSQDDYFVAQTLYNGWALLGVVVLGALGANIWAAAAHRDAGAAFWWFAIAAGLVASTLIIFFIWTYPANRATQMWTAQPDNWRALRTQWEFSHAASAALTLLALSSASAGILAARHHAPGAAPTEQASR